MNSPNLTQVMHNLVATAQPAPRGCFSGRVYVAVAGRINPFCFEHLANHFEAQAYWWALARAEMPAEAFIWDGKDWASNRELMAQKGKTSKVIPELLRSRAQYFIQCINDEGAEAGTEADFYAGLERGFAQDRI